MNQRQVEGASVNLLEMNFQESLTNDRLRINASSATRNPRREIAVTQPSILKMIRD